MGHIDLSGFDNWDPIGDNTAKFTGTIDGNCYSVYNLKIDRGSENCVGLFGFCDGAEIKNLGVQGANITGNQLVGILSGRCNSTTITNSYTNGIIQAKNTFCGGLTGGIMSSNINNSHTNVNINSLGVATGGISGTSQNNSIIENCYSIGNIYTEGSDYAGGIIGYDYVNSKIKNCYSLSNITAPNCKQVGGISGNNDGRIQNCYAKGTINGNQSVGGISGLSNGSIENCSYNGNLIAIRAAGGICGGQSNNSTIKNCNSSGSLVGNRYLGGILGQTASDTTTNITVENCFSSMEINSTWQIGDNYQTTTGGIIGCSTGEQIIKNCYSTGNVHALYSNLVGGGFGTLDKNTQVYNCFATGKVICEDTTTYPNQYGGLYGQMASNASIYNSYWNKDTSGMVKNGNTNASHVGTIENVEGLTSAQLDNDFIKTTLGWDESVWDFSGGKPVLKNLPSFGAYYVPADYRRFQVAEMGDEYSMLLIDTTLSLDLSGISLLTEDTSTATIEKIDELLKVVLRKQSEFGVAISQLEAIEEKNDINIQNISASISTIRDTDIAKESSNYVRQNILTQTASSLLSQASSMNSNSILLLINSL